MTPQEAEALAASMRGDVERLLDQSHRLVNDLRALAAERLEAKVKVPNAQRLRENANSLAHGGELLRLDDLLERTGRTLASLAGGPP